MDHLSEEELIALAQEALSFEAQTEIVRRFDRMITSIIPRVARRSLNENLWDLCRHEGRTGLFHALTKYDPHNEQRAGFRTYAYRWIYKYIQVALKQENRPHVGSDVLEKFEAAAKDPEPGAALLSESVLSTLPALEAEIVYRKVWRDETFKDIAEEMEIPRALVSTKYKEALARLKRSIECPKSASRSGAASAA